MTKTLNNKNPFAPRASNDKMGSKRLEKDKSLSEIIEEYNKLLAKKTKDSQKIQQEFYQKARNVTKSQKKIDWNKGAHKETNNKEIKFIALPLKELGTLKQTTEINPNTGSKYPRIVDLPTDFTDKSHLIKKSINISLASQDLNGKKTRPMLYININRKGEVSTNFMNEKLSYIGERVFVKNPRGAMVQLPISKSKIQEIHKKMEEREQAVPALRFNKSQDRQLLNNLPKSQKTAHLTPRRESPPLSQAVNSISRSIRRTKEIFSVTLSSPPLIPENYKHNVQQHSEEFLNSEIKETRDLHNLAQKSKHYVLEADIQGLLLDYVSNNVISDYARLYFLGIKGENLDSVREIEKYQLEDFGNIFSMMINHWPDLKERNKFIDDIKKNFKIEYNETKKDGNVSKQDKKLLDKNYKAIIKQIDSSKSLVNKVAKKSPNIFLDKGNKIVRLLSEIGKLNPASELTKQKHQQLEQELWPGSYNHEQQQIKRKAESNTRLVNYLKYENQISKNQQIIRFAEFKIKQAKESGGTNEQKKEAQAKHYSIIAIQAINGLIELKKNQTFPDTFSKKQVNVSKKTNKTQIIQFQKYKKVLEKKLPKNSSQELNNSQNYEDLMKYAQDSELYMSRISSINQGAKDLKLRNKIKKYFDNNKSEILNIDKFLNQTEKSFNIKLFHVYINENKEKEVKKFHDKFKDIIENEKEVHDLARTFSSHISESNYTSYRPRANSRNFSRGRG